MSSRIIATTLLSLVLLTHLLVPVHADTDIFLAGTSMNCDSLIESDPRAFVYMNRLVFTANSDVISFPREIREIYFGGDAVIDSIRLSGVTLHKSDLDYDQFESQISVNSDLLTALNQHDVSSIKRRLPFGPEDVIGDPNSYLFFDFSRFYEVFFLSDVDIVTVVNGVKSYSEIYEVTYSAIPIAFTDDPPSEPEYCSILNSVHINKQWALHPHDPDSVFADSSLEGAMGFVNAWRHACSVFDPYANDRITVGVLDAGYDVGPDFHPDIKVHPLSNVKFDVALGGTHGSAVASIIATKPFDIAADPNQGEHKSGFGFDPGYQMTSYIQGGSPRSSVLLTHVFDDTDWLEDLNYLIEVAELADMKVINFSTGSGYAPDDRAVKDMLVLGHFLNGIEMVAAAGTCPHGAPCSLAILPGSLEFCVTVSACARDSSWVTSSNKGNPVDLCGPGERVLAAQLTYPEDGVLPASYPNDATRLQYIGNTSAAAPHIAALIANVMEVNPAICGATASEIVIGSAGNTLMPSRRGWGIPQAERAILAALNYGGIGSSTLPGDVNLDHRVNDGDITSLARGLFFLEPFPDSGQADVNGDCEITVTDLNYLVEYLYSGGPAPLAPCAAGKSSAGGEGSNYPNPFNPTTTISFNLPLSAEWKMSIFNILGQTVEIFEGKNFAGKIEVVWDASDYASGVYFYRVEARDVMFTK